MHNQHPGLTGVLAEARMIERRQQAAHERLGVALGRRAADASRRRAAGGGSCCGR